MNPSKDCTLRNRVIKASKKNTTTFAKKEKKTRLWVRGIVISVPRKAGLVAHRMSEHDLISVGLPHYQWKVWLQVPVLVLSSFCIFVELPTG